MNIRLFSPSEAENGQSSRRHQQHRQGVGDVLRRAAVGDEQIVGGVEGDGRAQQPAGARDLQPRPPPCVCKPAAHDQAAEDVHGSRAEAPEEDEGEAVRAVLDQIAHIFKGGEGEGYGDGGGLDLLALRLKHQQIEQDYQEGYLEKAVLHELMESEDTLKNIYYEEMLLVIRLTLEKMPERRRLIFELSRFKELSYKEIAERLNISIRTVEHQVYLVLIELKKVLLFLFFLFSFK